VGYGLKELWTRSPYARLSVRYVGARTHIACTAPRINLMTQTHPARDLTRISGVGSFPHAAQEFRQFAAYCVETQRNATADNKRR
jgi:hypothetical protein